MQSKTDRRPPGQGTGGRRADGGEEDGARASGEGVGEGEWCARLRVSATVRLNDAAGLKGTLLVRARVRGNCNRVDVRASLRVRDAWRAWAKLLH